MQLALDALRATNQALVDSRVAQGLNSSQWYLVAWERSRQMWRVQLRYGGVKHWLGYFHVEEDAGRIADKALHLIGADERCNWHADGTPTGYGRGVEAHKTSGLLGASLRESEWIGVSEHKDPKLKTGTKGWRARLRLAYCRWKKTPCAETLRQENPVKCKCKTEQHWFSHPSGGCFKTAEEAARRYNAVVRDYGYDKPPYSMPLNPPAGVHWKLTSGP